MLVNAVYLLTGAFGGTIIGALGSGSSLVILPILTLTFSSLFPDTLALKYAVATCMATLIVGSISGAASYIKSKLYDKSIVKYSLPGVLVGSLLAPMLSNYIPADVLRIYIGSLISLIAVYKLFASIKNKNSTSKPAKALFLMMTSLVCSTLSGLAGVALGILMIPYLSKYTDHRSALGSNLVLAVPYSIVGTMGYVVAASHASVETHSFTLGYVYLPAFIVIAITMAIFPPVGLKIAKNVSSHIMQRIFYGYLLLAGIMILA
ncbi:sulfite exporter TauE/SafE family protein [Enterovibrio coralii]|uniref:Probable membrane transporter protein n=1 Tax=Enterovibrio coralii TaxID=294935 RepID=A0A135I5P5_9GAMM|nr:sulfite exporter TauE/SafE family protein [Enterovibrio coralii]KXF80763.1 hypothetical protein ATN88_15885 [Enterovibrio coralii]